MADEFRRRRKLGRVRADRRGGAAAGHARRSATDFAAASYVPTGNFDTAILWGTLVFALCGSETIGFLRNDMRGGMKTVVRVLARSASFSSSSNALGTAAMLAVLPKAELTRLSGLPDAIHAAFLRVGLPGLSHASPSRCSHCPCWAASRPGSASARELPMEAGIDNFLPPVFAKKNPKTGAPTAAILLQGALILSMVVLSQAGEGAAAAYDFLVSMSVLSVTIPYLLVFVAYLSRSRWPESADAWTPPGGARMGLFLGVVGSGLHGGRDGLHHGAQRQRSASAGDLPQDRRGDGCGGPHRRRALLARQSPRPPRGEAARLTRTGAGLELPL